MTLLDRLSPLRALREHRDATKLVSMFLLFFLVVLSVGILRPIRNVLALDGLAAGNFYQTYFVSAVVILFAPIYNRLADRLPWKTLIPGVAFFFAASFVAFRLIYREGSTTFGLVFYGWYDLYAAALVAQFFIATQLFFNAREAKKAYPMVIAGGSIGATLGGTLVGLMSERVGAPNMLLIAAAVVALFGVAIIIVWSAEDPDQGRRRDAVKEKDLSKSEFRRIFSNRHVLLIAAAVLLTRLVVQLVDYNFNEATRLVGERDAIGEFQGFFMAATQWTPIVVLAALRPLLGRWGLGIAVFMLPVVMIFTNSAVALAYGLWTAVVAKGLDGTFRYSAERTGREILYVPVPDDIKIKAKAWIDVGVDKGGKVLGALSILLLVGVLGVQNVAWVAVVLSVLMLLVAYQVRKAYVRSLAQSIRGRFASLRGVYAPLFDASTQPIVEQALASDDPLQTSFALDMLEGAGADDVLRLSGGLHAILSHDRPEIRRRVLDLLAGVPSSVDVEAVRGRLYDADPAVREAAVQTLVAASDEDPSVVLAELLELDDAMVRQATLACLAHGDLRILDPEPVVRAFFDKRDVAADLETADTRAVLATAAGALRGDPAAKKLLIDLVADPDPRVAVAALGSASLQADPELFGLMIDALGRPETRQAARDALLRQGDQALDQLIGRLNDETANLRVRWNIPPVLADIPTQATIDALIHSYILPETDQLLDDRTMKALGRLRVGDGSLTFPETRVMNAVERELSAAELYADIRRIVEALDEDRPSVNLLTRALAEAAEDRREAVFRWLGLVYPPGGMYRSYLTLLRGESRAQANAIEWIENTVGHELFRRLGPVVQPPQDGRRDTSQAGGAIRTLWYDEDRWLARLAMRAMADIDGPGTAESLRWFKTVDPGLERVAATLRDRTAKDGDGDSTTGDVSMDLIEKVFLLQSVDLLQVAGSAQLALLAAIADEVEAAAGQTLIERGEPTEALYVVIRGEVEIHGVAEQTALASDGEPFGTWALIDADASFVEARATQPTRLLRISRVDFQDLLVDRPELGLQLLQGLARRVRSLVRPETAGDDDAAAPVAEA